MADKVEICNLTLQRLAVEPIASITSDSPQAKACNRVYDIVRKAELRKHPWNFAIKRTTLAASTTAPDSDWDRQFLLPTDCIRVLKREQERVDWVVEGKYILANEDVIYLRYVSDVTATGDFDPLFVYSFSTAMAVELSMSLVDDKKLKEMLIVEYRESIREARRQNAFENKNYYAPTDPWLLARF